MNLLRSFPLLSYHITCTSEPILFLFPSHSSSLVLLSLSSLFLEHPKQMLLWS